MNRALHEILTTSERATSVFPFSLHFHSTRIAWLARLTWLTGEATVWDDCVSHRAWYPHHHRRRRHRRCRRPSSARIYFYFFILRFFSACVIVCDQDIYRHLQAAHIMGTETSGWQCPCCCFVVEMRQDTSTNPTPSTLENDNKNCVVVRI